MSQGDELVAELERGEFTLLNQTKTVGRKEPDWQLGPVAKDRLWTVTLHYHQWLYELSVVAAASHGELATQATACLDHYLSDWLKRCDVSARGAQHLVWNSYAVATRLVWWMRAYHLLEAQSLNEGRAIAHHWRTSMWQHAHHLSRNLEWDLRGNHLLRDLVGLACAGRFFHGSEPARWLERATRLAVAQVSEQVLPDGGHFERSPMYHLEVMDDLLTLSMLVECPSTNQLLEETWLRMSEVSLWLRHPDGTTPQLNDAAARRPTESIRANAVKLAVDVDTSPKKGGRHLADTGLIIWQGSQWTLFFDVGHVGPDYQPGHGHADTLTIDCSYRGSRLFVDPGCFHYDHDDRRHYDRSTAGHNTVCVDETNSSEVWHIFRVGRRARPVGVEFEIRDKSLAATASHDGYDHIPGRPRHTRSVFLEENGPLIIQDQVTGLRPQQVTGGLLLAPSWTATQLQDGWHLESPNQRLRVTVLGSEKLHLGLQVRYVHPDYGIRLETRRLAWSYEGPLPLDVELQVVEA